MSENELCHQLAYFQEISRTFEMNSPAGKLPNQLGWGGTGGGGGWREEEEVVTGTDELVGMLKKNIIIILTLPKLLKRTIS